MNRNRTDLLLLFGFLSALLAWCSSEPAFAEGAKSAPAAPSVGLAGNAAAPRATAPPDVRPPGAFEGDGGPSPVIFPEQTLPLRFNHRKHVKQLGVACTTCHAAANTSSNSADSLLPPATRCDACHGTNHRSLVAVTTAESRPLGQCAFCHEGYDAKRPNVVARVHIPKPNLRFDHREHVVDQKLGCATCHGQVEELTAATRDQLPRMKACITCHVLGRSDVGKSSSRAGSDRAQRSAHASGACITCHLSQQSGLLTTSFASGKLLPPPWLKGAGHGADFIQRHGLVAADDSRFCGNCHQERFCVGCHDGSVRPRKIHQNDFISQHPMAARQNNPRCTSCHQQQSFCLSCHQRVGVAMSGPVGNFSERGRFHPPKSVWTDGARSPAHHAWEAQRNLNACVSCHQERDCMACHATRSVGGRGAWPPVKPGVGANPHPTGFASRCRRALQQNARPCLTCHNQSDPELLKCR
jgi:hypothetical protein